MRTALLTAIDRTAGGELRAGLLLGGRSVLAWQAEFAAALGCERVTCLCEAPDKTVLDLQREVEARGGEFHAIRGNLQIASLVRADDEVVMLRDGLVVDRKYVQDWLSSDGKLVKGIASISAAHVLNEAQASEYERIDRDRNWAGLATFRASHVHKLADLPPDGDATSLLLRIALQARVECRDLPDDALENGSWMVALSGTALAKRERELVAAHVPVPSWLGPGRALANQIVRQIAPKGLEFGVEVSAGISALTLLAGGGLVTLGYGAVGLGLGALGMLSGAFSERWAALRAGLWSVPRSNRVSRLIDHVRETYTALMLLYISWLIGTPITGLVLPLIAVGLSYHLGRRERGGLAAFWRDRFLHLAGFALATATGFLAEAIALFSLLALADLLLSRRQRQNAD